MYIILSKVRFLFGAHGRGDMDVRHRLHIACITSTVLTSLSHNSCCALIEAAHVHL